MLTKFDLVVLNGVVVSASDISSFDIGIKDGKIHTLAPSFSPEDIGDVQVVMPGGIDAHVHLCQDQKTDIGGGECADNFETGSRSAVCGGTTTMVTFATQTRAEEDRSLLKVVEAYNARAQATGSYIDYAFHIIIVRDDKDILEEELPVLVFMTYETMRLQDYQLLDVMLAALKNSITTMIHAENGDMIEWLTQKLESKGMMAPYYHALSRPPSVEGEAANRAIVLAELIENPILFVHVGSSASANVIRAAQTRGLPVFAETCPQYLNLTWEDLKRFHSPICFENSKMVCSPPPGPDSSDQDALYIGLHNGTFTIFSSDHCPFKYDDPHGKMVGILDHEPSAHTDGVPLTELAHKKVGAFRLIPNGIPGVETRLPLLFTRGVSTGRITPQKFVELTATNPAKLYGLYPRKGAILPGSDADLVIWHPEGALTPFKLTNERLHHNVDYTPYEGMEFDNWPRYTISRGKVMWANGVLLGKPRDGQYLKRGPSQLGKGVAHFKKDPRRVAAWVRE
ncbi:putative aminohydrolase [Mycena alexandri]|uniref:dihydropyrimidinase n=1 Tax=Mycena alexandri TaxID=1745969 RepID=A0AAD6X5U1_9AGAR|nr:putative aminohydrolase [Mycena alexandri]